MTVPIEYTAKRYRCPHCRRSYAHRATVGKHMGRCFANPAVQSCKTCRYFDFDDFGPTCAEGVPIAGPFCSRCGVDVDQRSGACPDEHDDKPIYGMRVLCNAWGGTDG